MHGDWGAALAWAAQTATSVATSPAATDAPVGFPTEMLVPVAVVGLLFYLLIIKPGKTDERKRTEMIESMSKGDAVVTAGGIHGTVESIDKSNNTVMVNVAPKITLRFNKSSINSIVDKKSKGAKADAPEKTEEARTRALDGR